MKIATKIAAGYAILIGLVVAVLAYQLSLFNRMQSINQQLSGIDFRAGILSLQMLQDLDQVEEFTRKFFATAGDTGYSSQAGEMREAVSEELRELESIRLSAVEKDEVGRLSGYWRDLLQASRSQEQGFSSMSPARQEAALSAQLELINSLRAQVRAVIRATRRAIESQVEEASRAGERAREISWDAAAAALILSLVVSGWIIRSISRPLRSLTEGTRAVAEGKFFYQLDSSGGDELSQLAADFNTMTQRLSELDQMKKDFVSHVSHELKTPLASMQESVRLLLDEISGPLNEQQRHFLELNLRSSRRLSALIRNLLDLSRMEAGVMQYDLKPNDLVALIRSALAEFEVALREKDLRLEIQLPAEPVPVNCDGDRIVQVLGNLLGNALNFTSRGGVIRLCLRCETKPPEVVPAAWRHRFLGAQGGAGLALLSIADSGPGVPDAEKEKIFEKFHQVSRGGRLSGQGAGLGLAISRTIVEAHEGAICVEDNPGGGSVFYLLFRAGAVTEPATIRTSSPI